MGRFLKLHMKKLQHDENDRRNGDGASRARSRQAIATIFVGIALSWFPVAAQAQVPDSRWRLRVMDLQRQVKVEATIRFTNQAAESCMSGTWKRVVVETREAQAEDFFPLNTPLAYTFERGKLVLGKTEVCDAYLFLSGMPDASWITGSYNAVGWGVRPLGSFLLGKIQK